MKSISTSKRSPWLFFLLVVVLSIPFWVLGAISASQPLPISVPISALMAMCPAIAASILVYREAGWESVKQLLKRSVDVGRVKNRIWILVAFAFMPVLLLLEYGVMSWLGISLPPLGVPNVTALVSLFVVIFILGIGEEVGWMGYAAEPMQERWGALLAAILMGVVWGVWHTIPFLQNNVTPTWIFWQFANTIGLRVLIFWLYNNAGKSVFVAVLFHTMSNIAELVWPFGGDSYDPFINTIFVTIAAVIVTLLWGPKTLAHFGLGRSRQMNPSR